MHSLDAIRDLFAYDLWANRRMNDAFDDRTPENARELLGHVVAAQQLWMDRIDGEPPATSAAGDPSVQDFTGAIDAAHARIAGLLTKAQEDDLDRLVPYGDLRGNPHTTPLRDILLHVVNHGTHHRAQIARALREAGKKPPRTDFIVYWRETRGTKDNA